jgi:hypothetical protein
VANDDLNIHVRLTGARAAGAEAKGLRAEIVGVGKATGGAASASGRWNRASAETEKRGRAQGRVFKGLGGTVGGLGKSYLGAAKGILAAGAAFASYQGIKSAVDMTTELGKTTIGLSKNLGLSTEAASEWAAVAKTRGVDAKALNMSFGTLSKNIDASSKAGSSQAKTFQQLGVPLQALRKGNFQDVLGTVSDKLNKMGPGAERTAISMRLFGRGWQTIVPILRDGSKGMQEQLDLAKKYGATFGGKTIKSVNDLVHAQREAKFATLGLQIAIGTTLTPILTKVIGKFSQFVLQMRQGKGAGGEFRHTVERIWHEAKPVVVWFGRAAMNIGKFASHHGGLVKVGVALLLSVKALKLMKFGGAISGAWKLYKTIKGVEDAKFGAKIAGEMISRIRAVPGRLGGLTGRFRALGGGWGTALGVGFALAAGKEIENFLNSKLPFNIPGIGFPSGNPMAPFQKPDTKHPKGPREQQIINQLPPRGHRPGQGTRPPTPHSGHKIAVPGVVPTPAVAGAPTAEPTVVHTVVQLDGKTIWEAVDSHDRNRKARR